jgi:peptidoglycan hydrolase CwlO-like protein
MDWTPIIIAAIGVLGTGGLWQWMQVKSKLSAEAKSAENADKAEFRESLKAQVDMLQQENKELREKVEILLKEMAEVKAELAAANATIRHLEEKLRNR